MHKICTQRNLAVIIDSYKLPLPQLQSSYCLVLPIASFKYFLFFCRHNDLAFVYRSRVQNHINDIDLQKNVSAQWGPSHTDIPRMQKGLMGGQVSKQIPCIKEI